jgi:DNA topoisomerase IB
MTSALHRVSPESPGYTRRRRGRGFEYLDHAGRRVTQPSEVERFRSLAIPPAWKDVWICRDPRGHLQAVGTDAAGRRQYIYHEVWRRRRDREKYRKMERFAAGLPRLRDRIRRDLRKRELSRERVLACAVRLLDLSPFRIGSEEYAARNGSFGLATLRKDHVRVGARAAAFDFVGKSGVRHTVEITDRAVLPVLRALRRRADGEELFAYRNGDGWHDVRSEDVNAYIKDAVGEEHSAKDFRTWRATVLAASLLAADDGDDAKRTVARVVRSVADHMGNTPAVCRSAYIDPRIIDRYLDAGERLEVGDVDVDPAVLSEEIEGAVLEFIEREEAKAA